MNQLLDLVHGFLEPKESSANSEGQVVIRRQYSVNPATARTFTPVERAQTPYWKDRGWQQVESGFAGMFQTAFGSWLGYIRVSPSGRIEVFIEDPPAQLQRHSHWPCFRAREGRWFFIHATTPVPDVSAGILGTEKTLTEAFKL